MHTVNALTIRQHFGQVLNDLINFDEPIIIEKGRKAVAVLISLELFHKRFVDFRDIEAKQELLNQFKTSGVKAKRDTLTELRELRYG
ncbi:MAG: type II toxin-antitoxin system Phd/YefM family antitoxin [Myxococcaceae bacterium]